MVWKLWESVAEGLAGGLDAGQHAYRVEREQGEGADGALSGSDMAFLKGAEKVAGASSDADMLTVGMMLCVDIILLRLEMEIGLRCSFDNK
jgi:hypothetical protein